MTNEKQEELRRRLEALGFDDVRFGSVGTGAGPSPAARQALRDWLASGRQADMNWMDRTAEKRLSPELVLPGARSVVMLGVNYWSDALQAGTAVSSTRLPAARGGGTTLPTASPVTPIWARYTLHEDYHDTIKPALAAAGRVLEEIHGVGPQDLSIDALISRAHEPQVKELILALNATVDGQTTAHYITELLQDANIKVTRLAHGVPVGGELDYLDEGTLSAAIKQRTLF